MRVAISLEFTHPVRPIRAGSVEDAPFDADALPPVEDEVSLSAVRYQWRDINPVVVRTGDFASLREIVFDSGTYVSRVSDDNLGLS